MVRAGLFDLRVGQQAGSSRFRFAEVAFKSQRHPRLETMHASPHSKRAFGRHTSGRAPDRPLGNTAVPSVRDAMLGFSAGRMGGF